MIDSHLGVGAALILALATLDERERYVIVQRCWHNAPHRQIAVSLGVSKSRVCQLEERGIGKLQTALAPVADDVRAAA